MRNYHRFEVPEHPVIWAMERFGEYPAPDRRRERYLRELASAAGNGTFSDFSEGEVACCEKKAVYVLPVHL